MAKLDIDTLESYIIGSIELAKENALLLGGFFGSVVELLGRFLIIHQIKKGKEPNRQWFYDFIDGYLAKINPKYSKRKFLIWKLLRCDSAHSVLAQSGISFSLIEEFKNYHLEINHDKLKDKIDLMISTSRLAEDLKKAVSDFFIDVRKNPRLEQNCHLVTTEIYERGQAIIRKEIEKNKLKIIEKFSIEKG